MALVAIQIGIASIPDRCFFDRDFSFDFAPSNSRRISQLFGARPDYYKKFGLPGHEGIDFGLAENQPLFSVSDGTIVEVSLDGGKNPLDFPYGNQVRVEYKRADGDFIAVYAHLNRVDVALGQKVQAGEQLGLSGNTGNSDGPHLHFTLKLVGATAARLTTWPHDIINPTPYWNDFLDK